MMETFLKITALMTGIGIVLNFVLFPYLHREKVKKGIKDLKALIKPKDNNITSRGRGMV